MRAFIFAFVAVAVGLVACSNDKGGVTKLARLEAFDDGQLLPVGGVIGVSLLAVPEGGEGSVSELRFINTGDGDLMITGFDVEATPPGAFRLAGDPDGGPLPTLPLAIAPTAGLDGTRAAFIYLIATRPADGTTPSGKVRVRSNSVSTDGRTQPVLEYPIDVQGAVPNIQLTPRAVDFGAVPLGDTAQQSLNILNPGAATLLVHGYRLTGHPRFELVVGAQRFAASATDVRFETPIAVEPGMTTSVSVLYSADDDSEARGKLVLLSNDPLAADGTEVPVQANVGGPCITVNPRKVQFGGKLIGRLATIEVEIASCGDAPLELREIGLTDDSSDEYDLVLNTLPGVNGTPSAIGPSDAPVVLQPGQKAKLTVQYFPVDESGRDAAGNPNYDLGTLRIRTNMFVPEVTVEVTGIGVLVECPQAIIVIPEGEEVIPQTVLHLSGASSFSTNGTIADYIWEVDQPGSVTSFFAPSNIVADPTFEVNVAGRYLFRLTVVDSTGEESCVPAEVEVFVNPNEAIHVELLWTTPGDPVAADEFGPDLDMHVLHPLAVGEFDGDRDGTPDGWFDKPYDCFWDNKHPDWGARGNFNNDDPGLDRDDTDGLGPENLNLDGPEEGKRYRIGVNVWDDKGMGPSFATLRVFIYGNQVYEDSDVELKKNDMWWVTEVAWPPDGTNGAPINVCQGTNTRCTADTTCGGSTCVRKIVPNYVHPEYVH